MHFKKCIAINLPIVSAENVDFATNIHFHSFATPLDEILVMRLTEIKTSLQKYHILID